MTKQSTLYEWRNRSREISGKTHHLLKRFDGVCFYLDDMFRYALENYSKPEKLDSELLKMGADKNEIVDILNMLNLAGLIELSDSNE